MISADFPPHTVRAFTFSGGQKLAVFEGTIRIPFTAKLTAGDTIHGKLHYQACNDNVCLPPRDAVVTISTTPVAAQPVATSPSSTFTRASRSSTSRARAC